MEFIFLNLLFCLILQEKPINNLNFLYDITPANYINMVVCELGYIPPTSVPVVLREFSKEDIEFE